MKSVVHFDMPVKDVERAQKFYKEAFEWEINKVPDMDYWGVNTTETGEDYMPKKPGAINGGMYPKKEDADLTVIVIEVPSLDASLKQLEELGATIVMPKMKVGEMGYYARFQDPEGNIVGVWESIKKE